MAQPNYVRPELLAMLDTYAMLEACYEGERAIKATHSAVSGSHYNGGSGNTIGYSPYLPDPSPRNEDYEVRKHRYDSYLQRAVFYNVTRRTVSALVGQIFSKYPTYDLNELAYLEGDVDGAGQSLVQQAKDVTVQCLLKGGGGLLADMPVNEGVTKASMANGGIRPIIKHYQRESIINWRVVKVGSVYKLGLLVLAESYIAEDDGYKQELGEQLLVLRLTDGLAESEIIQKIDGEWVSQGVNPLRDSKGSQLTEIPFYFYGAVNNDAEIDDSPMYDIASLNVAHFRDSACYQEMLFLTASPTLVITGLDQQWVDEVLTNGVALGSRSGILLQVGATASLIQAQADGALYEAMQHKEAQMRTLGAKLVQEATSAAKTATEAAADNADQVSTLTVIANNVSDAYTKAVRACGRYVGVATDGLFVTLNTQFDFAKLSPEQIDRLVSMWQSGVITFGELREQLVESEFANIESAIEAKEIIEQENAAMIYDSE